MGLMRAGQIKPFTAQACCYLIAIAAGWFSAVVQAQDFSALVSPPRFELQAKAGERVRQVLEINHVSNQPGKYHLKTADWHLDPNGGVTFYDALQPGSCRPWVALERRDVALAANGKIRLRFEIEVPKDAPAGECRFALLVEGDEQTVTSGALSIPVAGRIGVMVYLAHGAAQAQLAVLSGEVERIESQQLPVLQVTNTGNRHGRVSGFLKGVDATGQKLEFTPANLPILPSETRRIVLHPANQDGSAASVHYPLEINGTLELEGEKSAFVRWFAP